MTTENPTTTLLHDATVEVVERAQELLGLTHGAANNDGTCSDLECPCQEFSRKDVVQVSFDSLWSRTPLSIQESTEHSIAEYFYRMGVVHGREMTLATTNDDLIEMRRLAGERLR